MKEEQMEIKNVAGDVVFEVLQMEHLESQAGTVYAITYEQGGLFTILCCNP